MTDRLMEILEFTPGDLAYNRSGSLSPQQQVRVARTRGRMKKGALVIGLILLAIAAVWIAIFSAFPVAFAGTIAMVVGVVIFGLPGLGAVYLGLRRAPKVTLEAVRGRARVARVEHTTSSGDGGSRTFVNTEIHMGDRIFVVPDPAFSELEDGADYAVYAWKGAGDIFSLERI